MADAATDSKKASKPAKSPKSRKPTAHPKYSEMLHAAITALKERGGSSRQAILKYIMSNYNVGADEKTVNGRVKQALRTGLKVGGLKQSKGVGASGSFKLSAETAKPVKKTKKPKSPAKVKDKKPATAKKSDAKKLKSPKTKTTPKKAAASPKVKGAKPKKVAKPKKDKTVKSGKKSATPKKAGGKK